MITSSRVAATNTGNDPQRSIRILATDPDSGMAEAAGLEFMLPLGRWAGYGGTTDHNGESLETLVWAAGLLAATRRIMAFSTLHVAFINPVFATAKASCCQYS